MGLGFLIFFFELLVRVLTGLGGPGSGLPSGSDFRSGFLVRILSVAFWVRDLGSRSGLELRFLVLVLVLT